MNLAPNCPIDLDTLMQTRMLLVAGSGGGKSYALRKLLEETATGVQQFVIDPEGEFASLREKHDYIYVAAKDGDVVASPKTAGVLAHRLLELGTSAILDLYELRPDERQRFVKHFFDALVNAPRELWHPVMVVLDEAHMFCPQNGSAEAMQSVIDVASRGRKKGLALVLATQRISKLHKDTAAEMQNKMLGLTTLDVDRRRVAEELGMTVKEAVQPLRQLERGEFFVFGPALTRDVTKIKVGKVKTTHASGTGNMARTAPAPSASVKKMLVKLTDLDAKAAHEARTLEELKAENARLKREAKKPEPDKAALQEAFDSGFLGGQVESEKQFKKVYDEMAAAIKKSLAAGDAIRNATQLMPAFPTVAVASPSEKKVAEMRVGMAKRRTAVAPELAAEFSSAVVSKASDPYKEAAPQIFGDAPLRSGAMKILGELAARYPAGYSRPQVGALTKFAHKGGTFQTYLSDLRKRGWIEEREGLVYATDAGVEALGGAVPSPKTHDEVMAQWQRALRSGAFKMLQAVVAAGEEGLHRANLADIVGMTAAGGTFQTYLSDLRRNGLTVERGKRLFANDILFP